MRTQSATSTPYASAGFANRRRVEKANASKRLGREDRRNPAAVVAPPRFRETSAASRFETNRRFSDCEVRPVAGFVAQILGQMMTEEYQGAEATRAYARSCAGSTRPLSLKYA